MDPQPKDRARDAQALAQRAKDAELAAGCQDNADTNAQYAEAGEVPIAKVMTLSYIDGSVADRCTVLLANREL